MIRPRVAALALLVLGAGTACTTAPGSPSATPTPTSSPAAPPCPAGSWRSTQVAADANVVGTPVSLSGGADVTATIGTDGAVTADFGAMQPATFTAQVAGVQVGGELTYSGTVDGKVDLGAAGGSGATPTDTTTSSSPAAGGSSPTATNTDAKSGAWRPVGQVDWADLSITVKLTSPVAVTVLDNVKLADVTNSQVTQAGGVIDLQPLLRTGTYACQGEDTLVITPSTGGGPAVAWTFARDMEGP
jgi:hypothetical protein